jgi:hypothetical protein
MFSLWFMVKHMEFYLRHPGLNSLRKPTRSYLQLSDYDPLWPANGFISIATRYHYADPQQKNWQKLSRHD